MKEEGKMAEHTGKDKEKEHRSLALRTRGAGKLAPSAGRPVDLWNEMNKRFDEMRREMDDIFWNTPLSTTPWIPSAAFMDMRPELRSLAAMDVVAPRTDVQDKGSEIVVCADMPGIPRENVEISLTPTSIEISGEAEKNETEKEGGYTRQERSYSRFYRILPLPDEVLADRAEACMNNGVLEVHIPKRTPTPEPRKTKVPVK